MLLVDSVTLSKFTIPAKSILPATSSVPAILVLPVATSTVNLSVMFVPTLNVVPSNVKFESSSSCPPVPAITILLLVRSSTIALATVASPSVCSVPAIVVLPDVPTTVNLFVFIVNVEPSYKKLSSVSSSPLTPTSTIPFCCVRSSTFRLATVACPSTSSVPPTVAFTLMSKLPVRSAPSALVASLTMLL